MKHLFAIAISLLFAIDTFSQSSINPMQQNLLEGDSPRLLSAMASSKTLQETLNGSKINIGDIVGGWHAQAIGQYKNHIYVAFSNGDPTAGKISNGKAGNYSSRLWIYNTQTGVGKTKELMKGYAHPCSIQITGKYLTIALEAEYGLSQAALGNEREARSMAVIFDLEKDLECGVEAARVMQENVNSGGAGLTFNPQTKRWYLLMDQDGDGAGVVIYQTATESIDSWEKEPIAKYRRFGSGAGLNLVTASDNSIWGLYYDVADDLPDLSAFEISGDKVYLFKLLQPDGTPVAERNVYSQVVNIGAPRLKQAGELLANRPGMRFGASLRNENGKWEVLTCQRNMADNFYINRTVLDMTKKTQIFFVNFGRGKGRIKSTSLSSTSQNFSFQGLSTESESKIMTPPVKSELSYLQVSANNIRSFSAPKWSTAGTFESNAPLTLLYLEGTGNLTGQMREFTTRNRVDKKIK